MEKNSDRISVGRAVELNKRAVKLWWEKHPMFFVSAASGAAVSATAPYVMLYFSARIINELAGSRNPGVLEQLVLWVLGSAALLSLISALLGRWKNTEWSVLRCTNQKLYADKLLNMDFAAVDNPYTHDLHAQIKQNENWSSWGLMKVIYQFEGMVRALFKMGGAVALSVSLFTMKVPEGAGILTVLNNPVFVILLAAVMLLVTFISPLIANKAEGYWARYAKDARLGNRMFSFYGFMGYDRSRSLDIRMYRQDILCRSYMERENNFGPNSKIAKYAKGPMGGYAALSAAISRAFMGIVYGFVCLKAWGGAFGVGPVTQYIGAVTALAGGVSDFIGTLGDMRTNGTFLEKVFEFLDIPNDMYQGSLTVEKRSDCNYEIEFRDVSFRYPSTQSYALRNLSLKFKIGERLAVVGQNGSGKTTFIKLLCRLYDPTEGEILLNGIDIRKYNYREYMSVFSVVFQDFKLLAFPLGQNIAAGVDYDKEAIVRSLEKAGFQERLAEMPEGTETCLYRDFEDKGVEISGGEAQKIAIARALYKDAPFIILDEPTAALDPVAEYEIYTKFDEIAGDRTAIYISHRLASCRFCDEIAVFHEGKVVQQGSHEVLLGKAGGKYQELWNAQAQYYVSSNA